jgi:hypothetical protein
MKGCSYGRRSEDSVLRRGFLKGAGVTAATTVIESTNALARETKDALHGAVAAPTPIRSAARAAMQGATPLSRNGFKTQLFETAIYRTVLLAAGQMQRRKLHRLRRSEMTTTLVQAPLRFTPQ